LIAILRDDEVIQIIHEKMKSRYFNWVNEIEEVCNLIKKCNVYENDYKKLALYYEQSLKERKNIFTCSDINENISENSPGVIDRRVREPLMKVLDNTKNTPHQFIVQCIVQECREHFMDEVRLKKHIKDEHECNDLMVSNLFVYALSQLYHTNFVWWVKGKTKMKFLEVRNYWNLKGICIFKHCGYDKQNSLDWEK
jgi:hypothetical protein